MNIRETLKDKNRIIIKIGSSSLTHPQTGALDLTKLEILIREICNIKNMGKDVILVSSGAIAVGSRSVGFHEKPKKLEEKQACAAIGQAKLMMIYQKLFSEYGHMAAQFFIFKGIIKVLHHCHIRKQTTFFFLHSLVYRIDKWSFQMNP